MTSQNKHISYCSVDGCFVNINGSSVSSFRVPIDPVRCQIWKEILGFTGEHKYAKLTPEQAFNRVRICSAHFDEESFTASKKRLLKTAIPTLKPEIPTPIPTKLPPEMVPKLSEISKDARPSSNLHTLSSSKSTYPCGKCPCCNAHRFKDFQRVVSKSEASTQIGDRVAQDYMEVVVSPVRKGGGDMPFLEPKTNTTIFEADQGQGPEGIESPPLAPTHFMEGKYIIRKRNRSKGVVPRLEQILENIIYNYVLLAM